MKLPFGILGISETKKQVNENFLGNVNLTGCDFYSQPSMSAAGGVALYVNSKLNYLIREELSVIENEFECIWIEVKNSKSKNILCYYTYRHPNTELQSFMDYIDKTLTEVSKENKLILMMGHFNCESHSDTNEFLNNMISHYLLPYILHPTRVTDHSATVVDNIFSSNTEYDTFGGNILTNISNHFP